MAHHRQAPQWGNHLCHQLLRRHPGRSWTGISQDVRVSALPGECFMLWERHADGVGLNSEYSLPTPGLWSWND